MENTPAKKTILSVSLINAGMNMVLAVLKIFIGKIGHSQALIADGLHSFSDLISDALVFFAARASQNQPDKEHPYGHQRIETIATIVIGLILFAVAIAIFDEAILRILHHLFEKPDAPVIVVAVLSIIINEGLFRYSKAKGEKINSNLLVSNAWHKRSDVFVSLIVLLSVLGSLFGWPWLDAIGAIIIAGIIFKMALQMIWKSTQELIDRAVDEKTLDEIKKIINSIPGVQSIHQLRTRMHGNSIFVDLHIIVDPFISVSEGHHIGEEVHASLLKNVKNLHDVTVHIDPENDETVHPSLYLLNREKLKSLMDAHWAALPGYSQIKKINYHYVAGQLTVDIYMSLSVLDTISAKDLLAQYRDAIRDIPDIKSVEIYYTKL